MKGFEQVLVVSAEENDWNVDGILAEDVEGKSVAEADVKKSQIDVDFGLQKSQGFGNAGTFTNNACLWPDVGQSRL